jgi:SAM-dependent methyltransferase
VAPSQYVLTKDWFGEQERLRLLETTVDPFSHAAMWAAGVQPGWRCLDVGAGSGSIARWLAQQTGDPGLVVATDIDPQWLGPAESEGVRVLKHDVLVDTFPPASFDLIHIRTVLEHLAQREHLLDRLADWLAPDGVLVVVDCASFPVFSSHNPIYLAAMRAWVDVLALTGTDYDWTRTLPVPIQRHGYRDVDAACITPVMRGGSAMARFWSLTLDTLRTRIVDAGLLSSLALDEAQHLLADPQFFDIGPGFVAAWGKRPT